MYDQRVHGVRRLETVEEVNDELTALELEAPAAVEVLLPAVHDSDDLSRTHDAVALAVDRSPDEKVCGRR